MELLKIGGHELDAPGFVAELAAGLRDRQPAIIVHGGGPAVGELQRRLGLPERKVDGLRVTDAATLDVAVMALAGRANKRLVAGLARGGVRGVGLSGVDGGLLQCIAKQHATADLGFVGEVVAVDTAVITSLLAAGFTAVIAPISIEPATGQLYNVNADDAVTALGVALQAQSLTFITNVPAVLDGDGRRLASLTPNEAEAAIGAGVIAGGMIPKVWAALRAVAAGIPQARITDLAGWSAGQGTVFAPAA